jgi:hypothetical protein
MKVERSGVRKCKGVTGCMSMPTREPANTEK